MTPSTQDWAFSWKNKFPIRWKKKLEISRKKVEEMETSEKNGVHWATLNRQVIFELAY